MSLKEGQAIITSGLDAIVDLHWGTFYYDGQTSDDTGLGQLLGKMRSSIQHIKKYRKIVGGSGRMAASYSYTKDRMTYYTGTPTKIDVFHEMVHVMDDIAGWYPAGGGEKAERLAYGAESMLRAMVSLSTFHSTYLKGKNEEGGNWGPREIDERWHSTWETIEKAIPIEATWNVGLWGTGKGDVQLSDLSDVSTKLGFKLSATKLTASGNDYLRRNGRPPCLTVPSGLPPELQ